jgi:hypothetical protein
MTEAEWLACTDPQPMLEFLRGRTSERKLRLVAVACVRRYWTVDSVIRQLIRVSELYADGITGWVDLAAVRKLARGFQRQAMQRDVGMGAGAVQAVASVAHPSAFTAAQRVVRAILPERATHAIQEIIGNPFLPLPTPPAAILNWNCGTVVKLAQTIYDEHAFDRLPILADALEDAGCTDQDILAHLRDTGPHTRGCWPVDLLLGKN